MDLSIVIPAYNEAKRLPRTLQVITDYLAKDSRSSEIIVVDDGSTDETAQIVRAHQGVVRLISHPHNLGKGAAVRTGMLSAQGRWRLLCDSDLSTPITDLDALWAKTDQAEVVVGSRRMAGASISKAQAWWKVALGQMGNWLIQLLAVPGIKDTQCGFKLFHERTNRVFNKQRINRWGYDFEILFLSRLAGFRIAEVPVHWANDEQSKVTGRAYITTMLDLGRIHINRWRGFYRNI